MTSWRALRERFDVLGDKVYLNTAGGGPMSRDAVDAAKGYLDAFSRDGDTRWDDWLDHVEATRAQLARLLRVSPTEIAFLSNASHGLNLVADMLRGEGEVVLYGSDFPSVTFPWLKRERSVRFAQSLDAVESALTPQTDVLCLSFVQFKTGARLDLERLGALCRERDVRLVVDGTQGFGAFDVDLSCAAVDAFVFSGYKWVNAGYGIAPLFVRSSLLERRGAPAAGWRSTIEPYELDAMSENWTTEARGLEMGHPPFAGVFALGAALSLIEEIGLERIESRVQELVDVLHRRLDDIGVGFDSPRASRDRSAITMVQVDAPERTAEAMADENILVSARGGRLRVSLHYYNDEEDIARFCAAL